MFSSTLFTGFLPGKVTGKAGAGGGLMGSLVGFLIQILLLHYLGANPWYDYSLIVVTFLIGMIFIRKAEKYILQKWGKWGKMERHTGELVDYDFNQTNIDEVHGQSIAGLPIFFFSSFSFVWQFFMLLVSLIFFRFFDTRKPGLIGDVEKNTKYKTLSIMLDDTLAGVVSALITTLIIFIVVIFQDIFF
jgi:phosphatidylglycerophosphatase A